MDEAGLEIRTLDSAADMASIATVLQQVWGATAPVVGSELLRALAFSGGYVAGAFHDDRLVGASFGFLARHRGEPALHSHVTAVLPGVQQSGVGRAVKDHQRAWASDHRIPWITWTFDPLVRSNAWFNLEVLGARVSAYLVDFYGQTGDGGSADDESDRLVVAWPTDPAAAGEGAARPAAPAGSTRVLVPTPDDIVVLRRTDPAAAVAWRRRVRAELGDRLAAGAAVTEFTRDGEYVLHAASAHAS